ncbi:MAG: hypothetical protein WD154_00020 [Nitrosopumilaceae archaeon]
MSQQTETQQNKIDYFEEIVKIVEKEVKHESDNIRSVLLNGFSAFTDNPINMRIFAPSSAGKTYLVNKVSGLFPEDNLIVLSTASAKSFKYSHSTKVIFQTNQYIPLEPEIQKLESSLKKSDDNSKKQPKELDDNSTKQPEKSDDNSKKLINEQIQSLKKESWNLIDFENKWLIFLDSQEEGLWEFLKTILSHDNPYSRHQVTNKTQGTMGIQKVVFKGYPAVMYCSAKEQTQLDLTAEQQTRFQTLNLKSSPQKYQAGIDLIGMRYALGGSLFGDEVINEGEIQKAKIYVQRIIQNLQKYGKRKNPTFDPFAEKSSESFPHDAGERQRQFDRFCQTCRTLAICNAHQRPKVVEEGKSHPIVCLSDVHQALNIIQEQLGLSRDKIRFFNEVVKPAIQQQGRIMKSDEREFKVLTAREIADFRQNMIGKVQDRKKIYENYLKPLEQFGFIESKPDPLNGRQKIFSISSHYQDKDAVSESILFDISTLNESCVRDYIQRHLKDRFDKEKLYIVDSNNNKIDFDEMCRQVLHVDISPIENRIKN